MAVLAPIQAALDVSADAQRRGAAVRGWRRRSHAVSLLRRLLPVFMIAVVGALGYWLYARTRATEAPAPTGPVPIRLLNPTFQGRDNGRPFVLKAREAVRDGKDYQRVALLAPEMELQEKPGGPLTRISALRGVYREDTLVLDLEGDVRYSDGLGWRFLTRNAVVDTRKDVVTGNQGIKGDGPTGEFSADRYVIYNQGERVILRGNVRTLSDSKP